MVKIVRVAPTEGDDSDNNIKYIIHKRTKKPTVVHNKVIDSITIFSTNAAGVVTGKADSLINEVKSTRANVVTLQETHSQCKGRVKLPANFVVFEAIRKAKNGGILCAVDENLRPKLVEEYNDPFELLVVEVEAKNKNIRIITGCGPQENWDEDKRMPFFVTLEAEIVKSELAGRSIIIEMDANAKLGPQYIHKDPHGISPNGKILANIIERHALVVANGTTRCSGTITRRRVTKNRTEESCIDIVMFSSDMSNSFMSLNIDEAKNHVLTKITKSKKGTTVKESDHNVLVTKFNDIYAHENVKEKVEVYNLKNSECQAKFKEFTSNTTMLSTVFDANENINVLASRFIKKLDGCIKLNFKKVRVNKTKPAESEKLYDEMRKLKGKKDEQSKNKLAHVIDAIAKDAERKYEKVSKELKAMKPDGRKINTQKFWKLKKTICPRKTDPPAAMTDKEGNLLTNKDDIQKRAVEVYKERLKPNAIEEHLKSYEEVENKLCKARLNLTKLNKTDPWTIEDLNNAIKDLDNNKSRDALGHANEIFKCAGSDLKLAVLKFMNHIKKTQTFPEALEYCNITSLYKHKGSHKDFSNYRGVFRVTIFRSILDRLMYNDSYANIDGNLTDGNVGARRNRNIRDNLFVLGAVVNSVVNGKQDPIQVQVQDAEKCFDKLWLEATTNALYEAGLNNDILNLLYIENSNARVAVKINNGITQRFPVKSVEMQGTVWGSLKCTSSMDILNRNILKQKDLTYKFRGDPDIEIGVLGMVDDNLAISKCGTSSVRKNAVINSFIETQRLTLSKEKSVVLHIGKENKCIMPCPTLKVHTSNMKVVRSQRYLGDIISSTGSLRDTIEDRRNKGWGKISDISAILSEMPDTRKIEIGLKLRDAKLMNGMIYSSEAWSKISDAEMVRLEQVDMALLLSLAEGHSKTSRAFVLLEFGVQKVRHIIMIRRLMYHHHLVTRPNDELIKKVYLKQKEDSLKGDWFRSLKEDFIFIGEEMNDDLIRSIPKDQYRKLIKQKVQKAAFGDYLELKGKSKKKMKALDYRTFGIQPYIVSASLSLKQIKLLFSLRSSCYPAKMNFPKMNRGNLKCTFLCDQQETQIHIFEDCQPIRDKLDFSPSIRLNYIYGTLDEQLEAIVIFEQIDDMRRHMREDTL